MVVRPPPGYALADDEGRLSLLVFTLGSVRLALRTAAVLEIVRAVHIERLPKAPTIVEGVVNVRGAIVPVLDIRARFGIPPATLHQDQHFIVARTRSRRVALRVDRAVDLLEVRPEDIEPASAVPGAEYVAGIARLPDGVLVIHDLDACLSLDESGAIDQALGPDASGSGHGARA